MIAETTITETAREELAQESDFFELWHIYPGYKTELPPPGSVALCGAIRVGGSPGRTMTGDEPESCLVCTDLERGNVW